MRLQLRTGTTGVTALDADCFLCKSMVKVASLLPNISATAPPLATFGRFGTPGEASGPHGAQPLPRVLEPAVSVADLTRL